MLEKKRKLWLDNRQVELSFHNIQNVMLLLIFVVCLLAQCQQHVYRGGQEA